MVDFAAASARMSEAARTERLRPMPLLVVSRPRTSTTFSISIDSPCDTVMLAMAGPGPQTRLLVGQLVGGYGDAEPMVSVRCHIAKPSRKAASGLPRRSLEAKIFG